jgi:hypothetical protein
MVGNESERERGNMGIQKVTNQVERLSRHFASVSAGTANENSSEGSPLNRKQTFPTAQTRLRQPERENGSGGA